MRLREVLEPGQFGVYRRAYNDSRGNCVFCYVAINQEPFARLGTSCTLTGYEQEYGLLRQLGRDFREAVISKGALDLPRYYDKPFRMETKKISGMEILNEFSDPILLRCLVLNKRNITISKESLNGNEQSHFEEGYLSRLM
jgi:hypothetical protein